MEYKSSTPRRAWAEDKVGCPCSVSNVLKESEQLLLVQLVSWLFEGEVS